MKTQSGRSMIEMLGVLAIIGVLSIGGLAGYTRAMNANAANNIVDYMNRCAMIVQERDSLAAPVAVNNDCNANYNMEAMDGVAVTVTAYNAGQNVTLTAAGDGVTAGVTQNIQNKGNVNGINWAAFPAVQYTF